MKNSKFILLIILINSFACSLKTAVSVAQLPANDLEFSNLINEYRERASAAQSMLQFIIARLDKGFTNEEEIKKELVNIPEEEREAFTKFCGTFTALNSYKKEDGLRHPINTIKGSLTGLMVRVCLPLLIGKIAYIDETYKDPTKNVRLINNSFSDKDNYKVLISKKDIKIQEKPAA